MVEIYMNRNSQTDIQIVDGISRVDDVYSDNII